jgi:RHH-type proline utilization regulon transcriptional repressor/proline dehydrogenase/delta 1-pyrroline-5-carboxylate dehydrogenase
MRAESLEQAIEWQNATDFGLTAGIHSLDDEEIALWREKVQAGNLYINRVTTGAIVQRQPFGGWKQSCIGPGAKAGGPNYVANFCRFADAKSASREEVEADYRRAWNEHFAREHDPSALRAESNVFRYRPCRGLILRLTARDEEIIHRAQLAAQIAGVPLTISIATEEADEVFASRLPQLAKNAEFLRTVVPPCDTILRAAYASRFNWIDAPLTANGRVELRFWLREQAVSQTRHRYGQLSEKTWGAHSTLGFTKRKVSRWILIVR